MASNPLGLSAEDLERILKAKQEGREALAAVMKEIWARDKGKKEG